MDKWLVCLKHGEKYSSDYVNKLYNMVKRNSTIPFNFACITENPSGLNDKIKIIPIPIHVTLSGWWYKTWVFSNELPLSGSILFFDLDVVVINSIDDLWNYNNGQFCIIRDFNRSTVKNWNKFNSSIFKLEKGSHSYVWENFLKEKDVVKRMHGDQDWIFSQIKTNFCFWPDEWIQSYKWEIRNKTDVIRLENKRIFRSIENPKIDPRTKVLVFHGEPKPSDVQDPIIVDNWR
jgi:hypothetical protein